MSWLDLLRMSSSNLRRRKLRTFLTVLGVVIGTASIVVMISLGLGMQKSLYKEVEESGGLTSITVTGKQSGNGGTMVSASPGAHAEESTKYITDDVIKQLQQVPCVSLASPVYSMQAILLKGNYEMYAELVGMTPETLQSSHIPLAIGTLPKPNSGSLEIVPGNQVITMFTDRKTGKGYWETGTLPDLDFTKDQLFLVLDTEAYQSQRQGNAGGAAGQMTQGDDKNQNSTKPKRVKKQLVSSSGVVSGDLNTYNSHSFSVYCDMETLKTLAKREFSGRAVPGQPTTKNGKPYHYTTYSRAYVKVDKMDNVEIVSAAVREMGYEVQSNIEYLNSMKSQFAIIQAVLGGIGAVSLFVAAIGIANTMMMSIYERTKEIGVIKVLGCGLKNIKQMFLMEAAFIGLIGGVVGNLLSFAMSALINFIVGSNGSSMGITGNISYIPLWLSLISMGFAVFVGMAAGYLPALRAMRLSPLAAINN